MLPGFEVGYKLNKKFYVNNHLMFKVLVHETHGEYTQHMNEATLEAAAAAEVRARCFRMCMLSASSSQMLLSSLF